ncbi:ADP-ribosyltransferase [Nocardia sp. NBC_01503]|uniref:ADP-ribosyltransferase n=1 Tax=Nocardia sp. NBC_01503 TaxID=2975997 RepID=UPI002E7AC2BD|nr:ADP-ribosyltransferase [Nocardia sp. NBC_01503]WTL29287.1 ADP-ribosyltransferase [Nocardia sp. NBC_01503]
MTDEGDEYGFDTIPLAETVLAGQRADRLSDSEADVIQAYTYNAHDVINKALWGEIAMTPAIERRIRLIRSGLAKYPLASAVRVTREVEASEYGIVDADSAYALIDEDIIHQGFLSTSGSATPPHSYTRVDPVMLDLVVQAGVPALRLGDLAEEPAEREVLVIDARILFVVGVGWDDTRNMWRIKAIVRGGE